MSEHNVSILIKYKITAILDAVFGDGNSANLLRMLWATAKYL
jgi:hypothetical protein